MLYSFATLLGLAGVSLFFFMLAVLVVLVFEIAMLVSVIRNKHVTDNARIFWVIGMLLIHPFVAIAYYLTDYKKG